MEGNDRYEEILTFQVRATSCQRLKLRSSLTLQDTQVIGIQKVHSRLLVFRLFRIAHFLAYRLRRESNIMRPGVCKRNDANGA
jgi:hypothetical protein